MTYEQALLALRYNYKPDGKQLLQRKLCNATFLYPVSVHDSANVLVGLRLFNKTIATWYPNGRIALTNAGWWSPTTRERYNRFMPHGIRVYQQTPYWYVRTHSGVRPFYNDMALSPDGSLVNDRLEVLNKFDAHELQTKVHEYAKTYVRALLKGDIARFEEVMRCQTCHEYARNDPSSCHAAHILEHVNAGSITPDLLVWAFQESSGAAYMSTYRGARMCTSADLRDVLYMCWQENQIYWRKPKSQRELIKQTELLMTTTDRPRTDLVPRRFKRNIEMLLEDFILEHCGFQPMGG